MAVHYTFMQCAYTSTHYECFNMDVKETNIGKMGVVE